MTYLKKIGSFFGAFLRPHPGRDWMYVFLVLVVVFLGFLIYGLYLFIGIQTGFVSGVAEPQEIKVPQISRTDLDAALKSYGERTTNFNARNFPSPTIIDPAK